MTYLLEMVRFIIVDSFSMFSLLSLSYCLSLPHFSCVKICLEFILYAPYTQLIYMCSVSMVTGQNSLKISALHLVISLRLFSSKVVVKIHP